VRACAHAARIGGSPAFARRKTVRRVKDRLIGEFDIPGMPIKFSQWPDRADLTADLLGEHNDEILGELLGLSDGEIDTLYADGVLVRDPLLRDQNRQAAAVGGPR
jgi:crotonobetainyl-CoA:carnitine CoA-transferase CaiB-like acyl-CoA transferase